MATRPASRCDRRVAAAFAEFARRRIQRNTRYPTRLVAGGFDRVMISSKRLFDVAQRRGISTFVADRRRMLLLLQHLAELVENFGRRNARLRAASALRAARSCTLGICSAPSACLPPLMMFIIGTGSVTALDAAEIPIQLQAQRIRGRVRICERHAEELHWRPVWTLFVVPSSSIMARRVRG